MEYILHILIVIGIYIILAVSLDLLVGQTGLLSMAHAAFYGLGAYSSAILTVRFGASFFIGILIGVLVAVLISLIVSLPSLRLHEDYFIIVTFGFQMIILSIINNWNDLTQGPIGFSGIPNPEVLAWKIQSHLEFVLLVFLFAFLTYIVVARISIGPYGRVLRAIREDEIFAQSLGKNTLWFKMTVFGISAALAASAGSLYAHYVTHIDPTSFTVMESILVISMVIIGGAGSRWGPIIGAVSLVLLPEVLRFLGLPHSIAANLRQIIYGIALIIIVILRPRGLVGRYNLGG